MLRRDIPGFEGIYSVTQTGSVISRNRLIETIKGKRRFIRGKILKPKRHSNGYCFVTLCKNGKKQNCCLHRLVAIAFIPNPHSEPQVNHINGNKTDNRIENLEWSSISKNTKHAYNNNLNKNIGGEHTFARKVIDRVNNVIFDSIKQAAEASDINYTTLRNMLCGSNKNSTQLTYY